MKIAFLSHLDLNLYLFRLPIMIELVKTGHEVYAVCPKGEFFDKFVKYGINPVSYYVDRKSLNFLKEFKSINSIRKCLSSISPDIIHTFMHKPNIYGNLSGAKNIVNTITGLGSFFVHNDLKSRNVRRVIEMLYKYTTKNAKKVIFQNSDDITYFIQNKIVPENKAVLIKSSGVDTEYFKPIPKNEILLNKFKLNDKLNESKPIVLMIARVIKDKGVLEYIEAANILKDKAIFLYVGDIDKGNKNAFMPDWGNVKFLGFRKDIKELISVCDIFVLPSYREGVPRTLLEAAAMGKPIVTTDTVGCREVVEDNKNGFLVPIKNYVELANKIEILINNYEIRERFGKYSREKAVKEFDVRFVVSQYINLYNEILNV